MQSRKDGRPHGNNRNRPVRNPRPGHAKEPGLTDMCFVTVPHPIGMLPRSRSTPRSTRLRRHRQGRDPVAARQGKEAAQESRILPRPSSSVHRNLRRREQAVHGQAQWSLSLPIIPPTVDRVREMLKGTKRAPSKCCGSSAPPGYADRRACGRPRRHGRGPARAHAPAARHDRRHEGPEAAWRGTSTTTAPTSPDRHQRPYRRKARLQRGHRHRRGEAR